MKGITLSVAVCAALALGGCAVAPTRNVDAPPLVTKTGISEMSPGEARPGIEAAYSQFIDVRTPEEYASGHAYRAFNIPLDTLSQNLGRLEKNEPVYIICRTDNRSREAAKILGAAGFQQIVVIKGGMNEWQAAGMPMANNVLFYEADESGVGGGRGR